MMRWVGNILAIVGGLIGVIAANLWWVAADLPAGKSLSMVAADFAAIAAANRAAAMASAISAIFIAVGEIIRVVSRRRLNH